MSDKDADDGDRAERLKELLRNLGHTFDDPRRLDLALTHSSVAGNARSNERLEFLGDRVLGLVVAHLLFDTFPHEPEGALARRHTALVRRQALARVANAIGLGACLRLSRGEEDSGGRHNSGLLADACEAVLAAIFLDGGLDAAEKFVRRHWLPLMDESHKPPQDPKTELQELVQGRGLPLPQYREISREGPAHAPMFTVEVHVVGYATVTATGKSKQAAEKAAAQILLDQIKLRDNE